MTDHKILIIKTGYSEILDSENNFRIVSLGDILRTTPILHVFKNDKITWVTDLEARPLLEHNPLIHRLLFYNFTIRDQLLAESFDTVINLEKFPPLCGLTNQINAWRKYGFRLDPQTGNAEAYDRAFEVLAVGCDSVSKKENKKTSQELLFEMVGAKWNGEEYSLGYKPRSDEIYDIALNTYIGQKWPTKAWPMKNWDSLEEKLIKDGLKITRQDKQNKKVLKNLYSYIDWINSSKIIATNDSLGLHLGIALKKKVLGLFGPTPHEEVYFYNRGKAILPKPIQDCIPCFKRICEKGNNCMNYISKKDVYKNIKQMLNPKNEK